MGLLFFPSPNAEKRIRKQSVATQVPWSLKSWGLLYRLHLRWVSPHSLLSESFVFSVSHKRISAKISFPYYMSIYRLWNDDPLGGRSQWSAQFWQGMHPCGRLINISIKSFGWSSKIRTGFSSVVLRDIARQHLDVMRNCCHEHKGNWSYTMTWFFHYMYNSSSLLGYFSTRSTRISVIYTWKQETQNSGLWNQEKNTHSELGCDSEQWKHYLFCIYLHFC